jgi:branched-chain amino acid transport system substrate-binding protein
MNFKRRDFLKVCSGLLTSLIYHSAKPRPSFSAQGPTIKIGVIDSLTGPLADFGKGALQAAQIAVQEFNQKGGILGRPVGLSVLDDQGNMSQVVRDMKALVIRDKAVAILGSPVMLQNKDVTETAESAGVPLFLLNPFKGGITADRLNYTFRLQPQANLVVIQMVAYLLELTKRRGIGIQDIGVFWDGGALWQNSLNTIYELARRYEKRIKFSYPLPPLSPPAEMKRGFDVILDKIRSESVDIMVVLGYPFQMVPLVRGIKESGIRTKAVAGFSNLAVSNPWFVEEQGRTLINVMDANYWGNPKNPAARSFSERFYGTYRRAPSNDAYQAYSVMQVLKDAIICSQTSDGRAVSACLHQREFQNHVLAQRSPIRFDEAGQNATAESVLLQVSNPVPKIIYPDWFSEMEAIFGW